MQARYVWESIGLSHTSYKIQRDGIDIVHVLHHHNMVQKDGIDSGNVLYMHTGCLTDKGIPMVDRG